MCIRDRVKGNRSSVTALTNKDGLIISNKCFPKQMIEFTGGRGGGVVSPVMIMLLSSMIWIAMPLWRLC